MANNVEINLIIDNSLDYCIKSRASYVFEIFCSVYDLKISKYGKKVFMA